jgi:hypothetical protein
MSDELRRVEAKFAELMRAKRKPFPGHGQRFNETNKRGVYVIYRGGKVLHVGGTPRSGLRQRLSNHLHKQSSFTENSEYLKKHGGSTQKARCDYVRARCEYRCLVIPNHRLRALLEAYAIGHLCPDHIGLHQTAG